MCPFILHSLEGILIQMMLTISQIPYNKGVTWPDILVGVVATVLLTAGLLPPYFELWKRDGRVIGFSMLYQHHAVWEFV